jgi:hypothetical protein
MTENPGFTTEATEDTEKRNQNDSVISVPLRGKAQHLAS